MPKGMGYGKKSSKKKSSKGKNKKMSAMVDMVRRGDPNSAVTKAEMEAALNMKRPSNKAITDMVKKADPRGAVTDSEFRAAMKKLNANKRKNEKMARRGR